jgi:hypothetical protein
MNKKHERNEAIKNSRLTEDFWRNVPVVDATEMICLFPQKPDLENAQPGDPENCVFARCIKRVWPNSRRVRIWRGVALVETKDRHGQTIAERYIISSKGQKALKNFDRGVGQIQSCTLLPPTASTKLDNKKIDNQMSKERREQQRAEKLQAQLAGTYKPKFTRKPQADLNIRNGSGHSRAPTI